MKDHWRMSHTFPFFPLKFGAFSHALPVLFLSLSSAACLFLHATHSLSRTQDHSVVNNWWDKMADITARDVKNIISVLNIFSVKSSQFSVAPFIAELVKSTDVEDKTQIPVLPLICMTLAYFPRSLSEVQISSLREKPNLGLL